MKNKRPTYTYPYKIKGFSLIEFLVASLLSMIVLMAVTSTYFTARNLNNAATSRLSVQQDLRNASTLLVRDARMAGSFGCFNMANYAPSSVILDGNPPFNLANNPTNESLIPISETTINYAGFIQAGGSSALVFQYGIDNGTPGKLAVASSCNSIAKSEAILDLTTAKSALKITGNDKDGMISIMKHIVAAYSVGSINGQQGLYRFQLNNEGNWSDPQLLLKNIQSMDISYLYVDNCPESIGASATEQEEFNLENALRSGDNAMTPALVQIRLNGGNAVEASADNEVQVYNINANVRGGNACANRSI